MIGTSTRRWWLAALVGGLSLAGALPVAVAGATDPPTFELPFECGERVYGQTNHGRGADGKPGTDDDHYYSVDFNQNIPRYDGDDGMPVVASAAGRTIEVDDKDHGDPDDYGTVVVDHGGGWRTLYAHMSHRVAVGTSVEAGDVIGRVSNVAPGYVRNHLHYQQLYRDRTVPATFRGVAYRYFPGPGRYIRSQNCPSERDEDAAIAAADLRWASLSAWFRRMAAQPI